MARSAGFELTTF